MSPDRMLTTRDVAERLGFTVDAVTRNAKNIPGARKVFNRWRFDPDAFEAWVESKGEIDTWAKPTRGGVAS